MRFFIIAFFIIFGLGVSLAFLLLEKKEIPKEFVLSHAYEIVLTDSYQEPNQQQVEWFNDHVYSVLYTASSEYPNEHVKRLIFSAFSAQGEDYRFLLSSASGPLDTIASTSHHDSGPEVTIMFYLPGLVKLASFYSHPEDYEDALLSIFLHEYRHTQQRWEDYRARPTPDWVTYGRESDAQWFVAKNVLEPMRNSGRLNPESLKADNASLNVYLLVHGDQGDPLWQKHSSEYSRQPHD